MSGHPAYSQTTNAESNEVGEVTLEDLLSTPGQPEGAIAEDSLEIDITDTIDLSALSAAAINETALEEYVFSIDTAAATTEYAFPEELEGYLATTEYAFPEEIEGYLISPILPYRPSRPSPGENFSLRRPELCDASIKAASDSIHYNNQLLIVDRYGQRSLKRYLDHQPRGRCRALYRYRIKVAEKLGVDVSKYRSVLFEQP